MKDKIIRFYKESNFKAIIMLSSVATIAEVLLFSFYARDMDILSLVLGFVLCFITSLMYMSLLFLKILKGEIVIKLFTVFLSAMESMTVTIFLLEKNKIGWVISSVLLALFLYFLNNLYTKCFIEK